MTTYILRINYDTFWEQYANKTSGISLDYQLAYMIRDSLGGRLPRVVDRNNDVRLLSVGLEYDGTGNGLLRKLKIPKANIESITKLEPIKEEEIYPQTGKMTTLGRIVGAYMPRNEKPEERSEDQGVWSEKTKGWAARYFS